MNKHRAEDRRIEMGFRIASLILITIGCWSCASTHFTSRDGSRTKGYPMASQADSVTVRHSHNDPTALELRDVCAVEHPGRIALYTGLAAVAVGIATVSASAPGTVPVADGPSQGRAIAGTTVGAFGILAGALSASLGGSQLRHSKNRTSALRFSEDCP